MHSDVIANAPHMTSAGPWKPEDPPNKTAKAYMKDLPVQIKEITIDGNLRTKDDILKNELRHVADVQGHSIYALHKNLEQMTRRLENFGVYKSVDTILDVDSASDTAYEANIRLRVRETGIPNFQTGSYLTQGKTGSSVQGEMKGSLRNILGMCETFRAKAGKTSMANQANEYEYSLLFPSVSKKLYSVELNAKSFNDDAAYYTSLQTKTNSFRSSAGTHDGKHKVELEIAFRDEVPLAHANSRNAYDASKAVIATASPSTKTSLKYIHTNDTRDSTGTPTAGSYVNSSFELALPPGTAKFAKFDVQAQTHRLLTPIRLDGQPGLILSLCYNVGILQPLSLDPFKNSLFARPDKSRLVDRYHLGGPLSLRGFDVYGAGPRANYNSGGNILTKGDSLGANRKAQVLAMISSPLPSRSWLPTMRAIFYASAGAASSGEHKSWLFPFGYPRASIGCGLTSSLAGMARVEVTYSVPLLKAEEDITKGFQLGVGVSMLQ